MIYYLGGFGSEKYKGIKKEKVKKLMKIFN